MNTGEIIVELMKHNGITASKLQKDLDLNSNAILFWKTERQKPSADALAKLADYFNVSTDYLLGRAENAPPKEFDFVKYLHTLTWETLTPEQKQAIVKLVYGAEVERLEKENKDKK